jgi:tetratricopeptide (TPR) repeat protein
MAEWKKAKERYQKCETQILEECWDGWLMYEGTLLHEVFGDLDEAERIYKLALKISENSIRGWVGLAALYVERQENDPKERNKAATEAKEPIKRRKT